MMRCGLLGEKLGHSYSPAIHAQLADYAYGLYEVAPEDLPAFLTGGDFDALNVTIPYKKAVIPYCTELSPIARKLGSVNVLVRRADGTLYGDNADAFGFEYLVRHSGIDVAGQKALVLGNGGASATIQAVLEQLGAHVTVISRHGPDNYENLDRHADAHVIVNTTPVGMYPNTGKAAVDLRQFPQCAGVLDIVYNPARTALLLQAESLGIPCAGGLYMLVAQAKRSCEVFTDTVIDDAQILRIHRLLRQEMENIILIGMPGSGKSTIAALLAERLHRPVLDSDAQVVETAGMSIPDIFAAEGEDGFRAKESAQTARYAAQARALARAIDAHFGGEVGGYDTYRYYAGNTLLRSWICMPLIVGLKERSEGTVRALLGPELMTDDGLLTQQGSSTFWDRSTLYALRGIFRAGCADKAGDFLHQFTARRLTGSGACWATMCLIPSRRGPKARSATFRPRVGSTAASSPRVCSASAPRGCGRSTSRLPCPLPGRACPCAISGRSAPISTSRSRAWRTAGSALRWPGPAQNRKYTARHPARRYG